jgi:hypothetical protein
MLALLSAFSTMLLGTVILSAATLHEAWPSLSIVASSDDCDTTAESGRERVEDEREEEPESKTHLFLGRGSGEKVTGELRCSVGQDIVRFPPKSRPCVVPIRGPPAA